MSDSEHSIVTYTSVSEDDSDIGSPGVDGPPIMPEDPYAYIMAAYEVPPSPDYIPGPEVPPSPDYIPGPEGPPSPDYVPGPEEPEQAPPSPVYLPYVPEPVYPEYIPPEDDVFLAEEQPLHAATSPTAESPGYIPESDPEEDPEEDPADYPAGQGGDDDVEEGGGELKGERLLALTTPPPSPLTPLSSPLPQIPSPTPNSPTHIEIPESCLPLQKRVHFASPTLVVRSRRVQQKVLGSECIDFHELQSADHMRYRVISELLTSDHKRQVQLTKTNLKLLKGYSTELGQFSGRQHGPGRKPVSIMELFPASRWYRSFVCLANQYRSFVQFEDGSMFTAYELYSSMPGSNLLRVPCKEMLFHGGTPVKTTTPEEKTPAHDNAWRT
ncbi:hypothetical protein Tco_0646140 [Tanacetum coccineum]